LAVSAEDILRFRFLILVVTFSLPQHGWGQFEDENLLVNVPAGYKLDYQARHGNLITSEMVPHAESARHWTEMLTARRFLTVKSLTPERLEAFMHKQWLDNCRDGEYIPIAQGEENGYLFSLWSLSCPKSKASGKPEYTWVKAIKGNDGFYVVQKAFRFEPSKEQVTRWTQYLNRVTLCDARVAGRSCPRLGGAVQ
jgi:hypothetical protein